MIRAFYAVAETRLKHRVVCLTPAMIQTVGDAFAEVIRRETYTCWSCAMMPDHVHLVIRKHRDQAEEMIATLKAQSRLRLSDRFPQGHPLWSGGGGWKVFLDHPDEVRRTIGYVERNPPQAQRWGFVKPYNDWPLHAGHSVKSPYVKALRAAGRYP